MVKISKNGGRTGAPSRISHLISSLMFWEGLLPFRLLT